MQVRVYEDRAWKDIDGILQNLALEDHSDADCILIAVLSHGELGILYASDHAYKPDKLWAPFNSEACPSLAGKPKLFFIQVSNNNLKDHSPKKRASCATALHADDLHHPALLVSTPFTSPTHRTWP